VTVASELDFVLPEDLEARVPAEARGLRRDQVRLLVSREVTGEVSHHRFDEFPGLLEPGDLVVVNNSATLPAAVDASPADGGAPIVLHLSTELSEGVWAVEPRRPAGGTTEPFTGDDTPLRAGLRLRLPGGEATVLRPYTRRLSVMSFLVPGGVREYLADRGRPIRYSYTDRDWPVETYRSVFSTVPGSAEMPSAARPFTDSVVVDLVARGVTLAPITLHTGVASPEAHEKPYPEWFSVPAPTARLVRATRRGGGRVIAIGTTVVRALESAVDVHGEVRPAAGWTDVVVTPERGVAAVDGLLTGLHEPRASHLRMLAALSGQEVLDHAYAEALERRYLWHEFGDVHLLLP
jgi:S-adenosylmethionine:tRNA ribosyltransferase-isomerase